jgi:hypothetical protein
MTDEPIVESQMTFGPYKAGRCFHIEKSALHQNIEQDVKIAEFLLLRPSKHEAPAIWIVEAKSSSPRPTGAAFRFEEFIKEICEKMINAFSLTLAARLGRHGSAFDELPEPIRTIDLSYVRFRFVLVINKHQPAWLPPLQDALNKSLRAHVKTWALGPSAVAVLNDESAQLHGLIERCD